MPVFIDYAGQDRDSRVDSIKAAALPALCSRDASNNTEASRKFDVLVAGAGPAGLMLTLLLSRYGVGGDRLLCLDSKNGSTVAGQADGLQPRTIEVFKSLGIADEIVNEACQMWEVAFWNPTPEGIDRTSVVADINAPARYAQEFTCHQGRIERILKTDLARYSKTGVQYNSCVESAILDPESNAEYPVEVIIRSTTLSNETHYETVRAKHIVGCDGAHSKVRRAFGLELMGDTRDHIWGVVDLVVDTDFPDIRRRCAIHSKTGSVMIIPRERIPSGDFLTRLYIQVDDDVAGKRKGANTNSTAYSEAELDARESARQRRAQITLPNLIQQAQSALRPYKFAIKRGTKVDWWAAYQIGQRVADRFCVKDDSGIPRVFIAGDACHTHSPKAGQGMNVSMMDSYNMAWKLAYHVQGLASDPAVLLNTYESERRSVAVELIDLDNQFSSMFSGQVSTEEAKSTMTTQDFEDVFKKINGFTTGCGIEYPKSPVVWDHHMPDLIQGDQYLNGILRPGRRFFNVRVLRHADSSPWDLQDDFPCTGRFGLLVITSRDLLDPAGNSAKALSDTNDLLARYPPTMVQLSVLHSLPDSIRGIDWHRLPPIIHERAEMRFHSARPGELPSGQSGAAKLHTLGAEDAYGIYGVSRNEGVMVVIRPDGYVGMVGSLTNVQHVMSYLDGVMVRI